ncbi:alpha/beta hydrolase [Chryseobacterium sp. MDT2-18]|uniref:alpha/beta hydrolase n=1 Tax=Chryseobacterium sp. MDT2-18 TaxID=1259136 RepID=UPI00277F081A|nr:alpha/beta fold hydrolase [Chryseobacterium sp. MDT2-18]MDQ0476391.1 alpha-beta hydrolase superfamily lysophospholipase [Chryseobacterium sp. MDT2-18]
MGKLLQYLQEKVVFFPIVLPQTHEFIFEKKFDEYIWDTPFQGKINVLHFKIENPKGVIIYFHGNSANIHRWGKIAHEYTQFGYDVLIMDYRGYGKSTGPRNEEFLYSDAQFCYDFAKEHYGENKTVVYGRSLGGAFAIKIASDNHPKAVILEATFFNIQDIVNRWLPEKVTDKVSPRMTYHFSSNENICKVKVPLYQFHGTKDKVVPFTSGKKLFEVFKKAQPEVEKKFIEIPGGNHDNLINYDLFLTEMKKILGD